MQFPSKVARQFPDVGFLGSIYRPLTRAQRAMIGWAMVDDHYAILDLNCGKGELLQHYLGRYHVRACGISWDMQASQYARQTIKNAEIMCVQSAEIPWQDASFDRVMLAHPLPASIAKMDWMAEVVRVLSPGGVFLCALPIFTGKLNAHPGALNKIALMRQMEASGFEEVSYRYVLPGQVVVIGHLRL